MKSVIVFWIFNLIAIHLSGQDAFDLGKSIEQGREIYNGQCASCHMPKGEGIPTIYPPLAKADFLMNETEKSVAMILQGGSEEIAVNGINYNGVMPNFSLSDKEVSDVMNNIRNTWGNKGEAIKPGQIKKIRENGL
jgi:nitrite reductase (NO-forming)